jgi:hypothetical protein
LNLLIRSSPKNKTYSLKTKIHISANKQISMSALSKVKNSNNNTSGFPKIGVTPNHPFIGGFSLINQPLIGDTSIYGNPHNYIHVF